jgi:hypothetical protein
MIAGSLNFCLFIHTEKVGLMPLKKFKDSLFSLTKILTNNKKTKVVAVLCKTTTFTKIRKHGRLLVLDSTFRLNWDKTIIGFQILLLKFFKSNKKFLVPDFPV